MGISFKRLGIVAMLFLSIFLLAVQPTAMAISDVALKSIRKGTPFYGDDTPVTGCDAYNGLTTALSIVLPGGDGEQKGFNFFISKSYEGKQLNAVQSAAIIGNFMIESGMSPKADNGSHRGIAQWDYGSRYAALKKFAADSGVPPDDLTTQLEYAWRELSGEQKDHDYSEQLKKLLTYTTVDQLDEATTHIQDHYEVAPGQATSERRTAAHKTYDHYGNATPTGTGTPAVSGTAAGCTTVGAVDCSSTTAGISGLSQLRQNVVCTAQAELALWKGGQMKPGTDFYKYTAGAKGDFSWCAYFVSYIYNQAGYKINPGSSAGAVGLVSDIADVYADGKRFEYHDKGSYVPQPGDIAIYKSGWSHTNLVVSVNANKHSMTTIGGNEGGNVSNSGMDSSVKQGDDIDYTAGGSGSYEDALTGFVTPLEAKTN